MNRIISRLGLAGLAIVAAPMALQAASDGTLQVTVMDAAGKPLAGATVVISSPTQIGGARTLMTDGNGRARFVNLSSGQFTAKVSANGYQGATLTSLQVSIDKETFASAKLAKVDAAVIEVVAAASDVDVANVTTGMTLQQESIQNLPLGRSQLAALTLVPGVVSVGGNPTLATTLNRDQGGNQGGRNNTYMLDGQDITNPETGTLRTTVAPELVQEQDVKTGGITAEYGARAGLFTNAVTISGGNEFSGGFVTSQDFSALAARPGRFKPVAADRRVNDNTVWVSGPILKDRIWFVVSAQSVKDTSEVELSVANGGGKYSSVNNDEKRFFGKLTWQIHPEHQLSLNINNNPSKFDNGGPGVLPNRLVQTDRGGLRTSLSYSWQKPNFILKAQVARHKEKDDVAAFDSSLGPQTTIRSSTGLTAKQVQLGNSSANTKTEYQKDSARVDATFFFEAGGMHTLKTGIEMKNDQYTETIGINNNVAYENFDAVYTYNQVTGTPISGAVSGAFSKVLSAINNNAAYASVKTFLDTNADLTVDNAELGAYSFSEADPSHPGTYYGYRIILTSTGTSTPKSEGMGFYVQDQWVVGKTTLTLGVRTDQYTFKADTGEQLWKSKVSDNIAPRLGISHDLFGDSKTKVYGFYGRYVDPIKLDMVSFGGSLISSVRNEDIRINNTWVTENVRGGLAVRDAALVDNLKNPKTDEFRVGLSHDTGNYVFEAAGTYRKDFDIVEDFDPGVYADADSLEAEARSFLGIGGTVGVYSGAGSAGAAYAASTILNSRGLEVINLFRSLKYDDSYWASGGSTGEQMLQKYANGEVNFFLGNLLGAKREYRTLDLTLTRKFKNNWGGFISGSLVDATGNSLSSGNADFQGDLAVWDPRLPYTNGKLEGSVDWLVKANAYYKFDNGLMFAVTFNANSGYHFSNGLVSSGRVLQRWPTLTAATVNKFWTPALGEYRTPSVNTTDLRVQYTRKFGKITGEVWADIFNVFNTQNPVSLAEGTNVRTGYDFMQPFAFQAPRTTRLGLKVKF